LRELIPDENEFERVKRKLTDAAFEDGYILEEKKKENERKEKERKKKCDDQRNINEKSVSHG